MLLIRLLFSLSLVVFANPVSAAIYGFIDPAGVAHFATEPLDSRYQLFMRSNPPGATASSAPESVGPAKPELLRYLSKHPNLKKYEPLLKAASKKFAVDMALLKAVMAAESAFNPEAVSPKGAIGLMQIMPDTAARYGVQGDERQTIEQKLVDPAINIRLGARHLQTLIRLFPDRRELVLAAYNAGEGAVRQYKNQIPPYAETRNYVQLVSQFEQLYGGPAKPAVNLPSGRKLLAGMAEKGRRIVLTLQGPRNLPDAPVALHNDLPSEPVIIASPPVEAPPSVAAKPADKSDETNSETVEPAGKTVDDQSGSLK
ncbi:MAG TPA: lytic transglycosylase domain-containing protein [Accumulibacter sp.]|uniref:lytic transglycosylase domain-containing protein n=1 Tax=Accumulibacter sp. TaxID=2053492 RepID=UPI00287B1728|nr:lytic transglycosylase domain-containing protein [Accumulibacter sp.]MDS4074681.1 lytic transglycosylase domain-containing protein [Accumulibacter sp.]HMW19069.1 lytic transglycosylase domain-containing protein [Accumulibacter sp.]HMX23095.1 lytic transglycosylase domain-containing protein [Accumulibacter sp.]HNC21902.1 lytic transglycosylase domain-containing protein [Accumulibacter sp.]HND81525.1 lytic transglycosylase domain-containing protein [Accumulibacter sp.]